MRLIVFLRRRSSAAPSVAHPDDHLARGAVRPGPQQLLDLGATGEASPWFPICVASCGTLPPSLGQTCFPDVVSERLLAVDVLPSVSPQIQGENSVTICSVVPDHDSHEVIGYRTAGGVHPVVLRFQVSLGRRIHGILVDVTENRDLFRRIPVRFAETISALSLAAAAPAIAG